MKKIIIAALLIAAISLVTTACGDKEEPTNKEEKKKAAINISSDSLNYTTKNIQEFSYEVPENWREPPSTDTLTYFYPEDAMLMIQFNEMKGISIGDKNSQAQWSAGLAQAFESFELIESSDSTILDRNAFVQNATLKTEGVLYNAALTTFDSNGGIITFMLATLDSSDYSYDDVYNYIVASIKEIEDVNTEELVNMTLTDAINTLTELGYTATYLHADSGLDFTDELSAYTPEELTKWIVLSADVIDIKNKIVQLTINTYENIAANESAQAVQNTLIAKLEPNSAWEAVEAYGETQYPYGFELHWMMGQLAEEAKDENTWFLKATATITNEYGAELETVCEADVKGTTVSPEVTNFYVYQ